MKAVCPNHLSAIPGGANPEKSQAGMKEDIIVNIVSHLIIAVGQALWEIVVNRKGKSPGSSPSASCCVSL